jgi:capsular polysaccharide transport system permease protein
MPDPVAQGASAREVGFPQPRQPIGAAEAADVAKAISRALRRAANRSRAPSAVVAGGGGEIGRAHV